MTNAFSEAIIGPGGCDGNYIKLCRYGLLTFYAHHLDNQWSYVASVQGRIFPDNSVVEILH